MTHSTSERLINERLLWLDALRGILATCVVVSHWAAIQWVPWDVEPALQTTAVKLFFALGGPSVDVFFVLSGFVIGRFFLRHNITWPNFLKWRLIRLLPVAWAGAVLGLCVKAILLALHALNGNSLWQELSLPLSAQDILGFICYAMPLTFHHGKLNPALWSISPEILFVSFASFIFLAFKRYQRSPWLVWSGLTLTAMILAWFSVAIVWLYFPLFLLGVLTAVSPPAVWNNASNLVLIVCSLNLLLVSIIVSHGFLAGDDSYVLPRYLDMWGAALLVFALAKVQRPSPKILRFLGAISYSLYASHVPVMVLVAGVLSKYWALDLGWGGLLALPVVVFIAWLLHHGVERPCIEWSRHFRRLNSTPIKGGADDI